MDELMEKITPNFRKYLIPLSLGIIGVIFSGYGLIQSTGSQESDEMFLTTETQASENVTSDTIAELTVDISGAVNTPGVYTLPKGSRIKDALEKAGGLSESADMDFVERSFNLAAILQDGSKLYIPEVGEGIGSSTNNAMTNNIQAVAGIDNQGLININTASDSELDTLPGVGPVTARKIIDNRPYTSADELLSKKVVTSSVFEKIKERISIY